MIIIVIIYSAEGSSYLGKSWHTFRMVTWSDSINNEKKLRCQIRENIKKRNEYLRIVVNVTYSVELSVFNYDIQNFKQKFKNSVLRGTR